MKAITILQPWASLIACGAKIIETRSWKTNYRGPLAIHAGKKDPNKMPLLGLEKFEEVTKNALGKNGLTWCLLPVGSVVAIADLVDCMYIVCHPGTNIDVAKNISIGAESITLDKRDPDFGKYIVPTEQEIALGDWTPGRYAWVLENVRQIEPVPAKGKQGLWEWEDHANDATRI